MDFDVIAEQAAMWGVHVAAIAMWVTHHYDAAVILAWSAGTYWGHFVTR